jgi:PPOX class probable FMN-dependent enzyme
MSNQFKLHSTDEIEALYAPPHPPVVNAVKDHLTDFHLQYIEKATFFCLATGTDEGLDCSPRGGEPGFVRVIDPKTVCFADWPGNNKIASLRNLTERDQVAMLFLFPGLDIFMRINGRAGVTVDEPLLEQLTEGNRRPKTAIVVMVDYVFYHCGKAINRARLWKPDAQLERRSLPSPGVMMKELAKIEDLASEDLDRKYDDAMKHELYTSS